MEIHQLRYFVSVAEAGSFTHAAQTCHVAQPSLSQQIRKLEEELGHALFERLGRRVRLTAAGHILYERAASILASLAGTKGSRTLAMVWNKRRYRSPLVTGLIDTIRAESRRKARPL